MKSLFSLLDIISLGYFYYLNSISSSSKGTRSLYKITEINENYVSYVWVGNYDQGVKVTPSRGVVTKLVGLDEFFKKFAIYPYEVKN